MKYDYLLAGAGLFNAVLCERLTANGKKCLVIDKRPHIGGNIYTENIDGIQVHKYGAHIFHTESAAVYEYMCRFAEFNGFINSPRAFYNGRLYSLPFNMNTFREIWGVTDAEHAQKKIRESIADEFTSEPRNLEQQAINLVGREVYEILVKGYTEKQWGRPCTELPPFIIKRLPLRFTFDNNYFNDKYQGIPVGGYTKMLEKMFAGADIRLNCDYFEHKAELGSLCEKTVFTGRIDSFYGYRFGVLDYRSLRFETETLSQKDFQGNAVINYTSGDVPFTRIIEHKYFEPENTLLAETEKTVITREYPQCFDGKNEPYYPVNDEKNNAVYERYAALAACEKNVIFGGRLGLYKYLDMDKVVMCALETADKLLKDN